MTDPAFPFVSDSFISVYAQQRPRPIPATRGVLKPTTARQTSLDAPPTVTTRTAYMSTPRAPPLGYLIMIAPANAISPILPYSECHPDSPSHLHGIQNPPLANGSGRFVTLGATSMRPIPSRPVHPPPGSHRSSRATRDCPMVVPLPPLRAAMNSLPKARSPAQVTRRVPDKGSSRADAGPSSSSRSDLPQGPARPSARVDAQKCFWRAHDPGRLHTIPERAIDAVQSTKDNRHQEKGPCKSTAQVKHMLVQRTARSAVRPRVATNRDPYLL
ncbi:hypothetical protein BDV93DRAFT_560989 [Ceratobasidium sp. AG-I]|nr:hypothetical protein BDV93DRAFT_560989 [Ceratobasidium sp. AG-I]